MLDFGNKFCKGNNIQITDILSTLQDFWRAEKFKGLR